MRIINFKTFLILPFVVGLVGCSKAPQPYVEATYLMASDICEGFITDVDNHNYFLMSERSVVYKKNFYFTCISDEGSKRMEMKYRDIPVKYFKGEKSDGF